MLYPWIWIESVQRYALAAVNATTMKVLWQRHDLPIDGSFTITQGLRDGVLVGANNTAQTVAMLDAVTGEPVWTLPLMGSLRYAAVTPLRDGGFLASGIGEVICFSSAGVKRWYRGFPGVVNACRTPLGMYFSLLPQYCLLE